MGTLEGPLVGDDFAYELPEAAYVVVRAGSFRGDPRKSAEGNFLHPGSRLAGTPALLLLVSFPPPTL